MTPMTPVSYAGKIRALFVQLIFLRQIYENHGWGRTLASSRAQQCREVKIGHERFNLGLCCASSKVRQNDVSRELGQNLKKGKVGKKLSYDTKKKPK